MAQRKYSGVDYYETPIKHVQKFLTEFEQRYGKVNNQPILEPCAGSGVYVDILELAGANVVSMDMREELDTDFVGDYLQESTTARAMCKTIPQHIFMHPPIGKAHDFIRKAFSEVAYGGCVVAFLPISFFSGVKSKQLYQSLLPHLICAHTESVRFNLREESGQYMHVVWRNVNHVDPDVRYCLI